MDTFTHPELKDGEVFFTNSDTEAFNRMNWKTKRRGNMAYDGNGDQTGDSDWFPVFISITELENSGKKLRDIRKEFWMTIPLLA